MDIKFKPKDNKMVNDLAIKTAQKAAMKEAAEDDAEVKRLWRLSTEMICESCGENHFVMTYRIRKVTALASGYPKDVVLKPFIPVPICSDCGHINAMFEQPSAEVPDING